MAKQRFKPNGSYAQIPETEWHRTFTPLAKEADLATVSVLIYLWSNPQRKFFGIYRFHEDYAVSDLGITKKQLLHYLDVLTDKGFILFDKATREIYVKDMLRTQSNGVKYDSEDNRSKGVTNELSVVQSEWLKERFVEDQRWRPKRESWECGVI